MFKILILTFLLFLKSNDKEPYNPFPIPKLDPCTPIHLKDLNPMERNEIKNSFFNITNDSRSPKFFNASDLINLYNNTEFMISAIEDYSKGNFSRTNLFIVISTLIAEELEKAKDKKTLIKYYLTLLEKDHESFNASDSEQKSQLFIFLSNKCHELKLLLWAIKFSFIRSLDENDLNNSDIIMNDHLLLAKNMSYPDEIPLPEDINKYINMMLSNILYISIDTVICIHQLWTFNSNNPSITIKNYYDEHFRKEYKPFINNAIKKAKKKIKSVDFFIKKQDTKEDQERKVKGYIFTKHFSRFLQNIHTYRTILRIINTEGACEGQKIFNLTITRNLPCHDTLTSDYISRNPTNFFYFFMPIAIRHLYAFLSLEIITINTYREYNQSNKPSFEHDWEEVEEQLNRILTCASTADIDEIQVKKTMKNLLLNQNTAINKV